MNKRELEQHVRDLQKRQTILEEQFKDGFSKTTLILGACDIDEIVNIIEKRITLDQSVSYDLTQEETELPLTPEDEEQLSKVQQMFRFGIEKQEETGEVRLFPMNGDSFITLHNEEDAKFFISHLLDCYRKV